MDENVAKVSDILFATIKRGNTNIGRLASAVDRSATQFLAMMEGIAGVVIQKRTPVKSKKRVQPSIGLRNKICSGCGHKNKKCTCS